MMQSSRLPGVRLSVLTCLFLSAFTSVTSAQSQRRDSVIFEWSDPAVATLMLVDTLAGPGARAVVIRRGGDGPNNIILVTRSTVPSDLSRAVTALAFSRRNKGDQVRGEMRTTITASPAIGTKPTADDRRAERDLKRVRLAPEFSIRGIARGPAIVIRMADGAVARTPEKTPRR